jgi:hypothetical protein
MTEPNHLNGVRGAALDRIRKSERNFKLAFLAAFLIESAFLAAFLWIGSLKDRGHVLLLLSTVATYTILAFGLLALGAHVSRNTQLVLRAIELLDDRATDLNPSSRKL